MSWRIARSTPLVAGWQPEAFCPWAVSTDTYDRGDNMGDRSVAHTWSSAVDGRPDWPSDCCRRHWPNVWCECYSLSTHCTKVRGSTSSGTDFAQTSTRPSVRTHRGRHPARSGRPRGARRKMAHGALWGVSEHRRGVLKHPWALNQRRPRLRQSRQEHQPTKKGLHHQSNNQHQWTDPLLGCKYPGPRMGGSAFGHSTFDGAMDQLTMHACGVCSQAWFSDMRSARGGGGCATAAPWPRQLARDVVCRERARHFAPPASRPLWPLAV